MGKNIEGQLEGPGKHNGRKHPVAEKVRDARLNPEPKKKALADRKESTGQHQK